MDEYHHPQTEQQQQQQLCSSSFLTMRSFSDWPGLSLEETHKTNSFPLENKPEPSVSTPNTQSSHGSSTTTVKVPLPSASGRRRSATPTRRSRSPFFRRRSSSTGPRRKRNHNAAGPRPPLRQQQQQQRTSFWRRGNSRNKQDQPPVVPVARKKKEDPILVPLMVVDEKNVGEPILAAKEEEEEQQIVTSAPQPADGNDSNPSIEVTPSYQVDYASRAELASDGSCVEVYLGGGNDNDIVERKERQQEVAVREPPAVARHFPSRSEPPQAKPQSRQGSTDSSSSAQKNSRNNGSREQSHVDRPASTPAFDTTPRPPPALPLERGFSMMEQSLAKRAAVDQMKVATTTTATATESITTTTTIPVAVIDSRDVSDLVSELSDGPVAAAPRNKSAREAAPKQDRTLKKESVNRVRFALTKLQEEAEEGKKLSPKNIVKKILAVTDTLESKRDRELIRRQLSQLSSFSEESSQMLATTTPETATDAHTQQLPSSFQPASRWLGEADDIFLPMAFCQFPGDRGDDVSETSSFVDWLQHQENKNPWNFSDMLDVSSLWRNPEEKEWVDFTEDYKEHSSTTTPHETEHMPVAREEASVRDEPAENFELKHPPKIKRQLSANRTFQPQSSYSSLQYEKLQSAQRKEGKPSTGVTLSKDKCSSSGRLPARQRTSEELAMTKRRVYEHERKTERPQGQQGQRTSKQQDMNQPEMLFVRRKASGNERTLESVPSDEMSHERYRTYLGERAKQRSDAEGKASGTVDKDAILARQALQNIKMRHQTSHADYLRRRNQELALAEVSHDENHRRKALDP